MGLAGVDDDRDIIGADDMIVELDTPVPGQLDLIGGRIPRSGRDVAAADDQCP